MLSAAFRMRSSADFSRAIRQGLRARGGVLVVHQQRAAARSEQASQGRPLVGFVVGRSVGNSVVRHRVVRRLRAVAAARVAALPADSRTVVRALPDAAFASSAGLAADFDQALRKLNRAFAASSPGSVR